MAWKTCPYCTKRLNGSVNMDLHQYNAHPTEYRIAKAQKAVARAEGRLADSTTAKEEYSVLDGFLLHTNLPQLVVDILTKERDKRLVYRYRLGELVVIPFDEQSAEDTAWLAAKRADLAALQEVPA